MNTESENPETRDKVATPEYDKKSSSEEPATIPPEDAEKSSSKEPATTAPEVSENRSSEEPRTISPEGAKKRSLEEPDMTSPEETGESQGNNDDIQQSRPLASSVDKYKSSTSQELLVDHAEAKKSDSPVHSGVRGAAETPPRASSRSPLAEPATIREQIADDGPAGYRVKDEGNRSLDGSPRIERQPEMIKGGTGEVEKGRSPLGIGKESLEEDAASDNTFNTLTPLSTRENTVENDVVGSGKPEAQTVPSKYNPPSSKGKLRVSGQELLTGEKPRGAPKREQVEDSSLKLPFKQPEQIYMPSNLTGPTASQYSYREGLVEIKGMEKTLEERARMATFDFLNQNLPAQCGSLHVRESLTSTGASSEDLNPKMKVLDNKIKTINRRLQESKREKNQLELRIQKLELDIIAANNEKFIKSLLDRTPTEQDLIALERIKQSMMIRAERVKAIKEAERRTNVLNRVLETADSYINSLSVVSRYKMESTDLDFETGECPRARSHELAEASFPKPVDVIMFDNDEDVPERDSSTDLTRVKSATSDLKGSGNAATVKSKGSKSKPSSDTEEGQDSVS